MTAPVEAHRQIPIPKRRYIQSLVDGDSDESAEVLVGALHGSVPSRLLLDLIGPVVKELGRKCEAREINFAQHNNAGQIILGHLDLLRRMTKTKPTLERRVVIAALSGDRHSIGARIVADFLRFEGFRVDFLGADTPPADLVAFVREIKADLVGLSVTMRESRPFLKQAVDGLRNLPGRPRILAGGAALANDNALFTRDRIDGYGIDAAAAVNEARRLLGLTESSCSLDHVLRDLGGRIQRLRKSRGWNQSQLAETAHVDRGYISSVENGKHNLTIGVALRIADALEVPLELLLGGGASPGSARV